MEFEFRKEVKKYLLYLVLGVSICVFLANRYQEDVIKRGASLRRSGDQTIEVYFRRLGRRYISPSEFEERERLGGRDSFCVMGIMVGMAGTGLWRAFTKAM